MTTLTKQNRATSPIHAKLDHTKPSKEEKTPQEYLAILATTALDRRYGIGLADGHLGPIINQ